MSDVKRIALFLDGTWNNVDDNTNVYRAKSLCNKSPEQLCYYSAGVGTQKGEHLSGGMFGIGINEEVLSRRSLDAQRRVVGAVLRCNLAGHA